MYRLLQYVARFAVLLLVLPMHEFAHAFAAKMNGDDTAKMMGRYTLNPFKHFDILGLASFMLVGSVNPCPCGNYGSKTAECRCSASQIEKYRARISGPLLDRIDLQIEVDGVSYDDLASDGNEECSADVRRRVNRTRLIQRERFINDGIRTNSEMKEKQLEKYCKLSPESETIMRMSFESLGLSARGRSRILKVARTIADMNLENDILPEHILEAVGYRNFSFSKR